MHTAERAQLWSVMTYRDRMGQGEAGGRQYMYTDSWFTLLYSRNQHNIVKQLCCCLVAKSCPTLCNPIDCSPPGSSVLEIFEARIIEWVAISFSKSDYTPNLKKKKKITFSSYSKSLNLNFLFCEMELLRVSFSLGGWEDSMRLSM